MPTRRVFVGCGDPPDPDQSGFAWTVYLVQVCKQHDPDPRQSMPTAGSPMVQCRIEGLLSGRSGADGWEP